MASNNPPPSEQNCIYIVLEFAGNLKFKSVEISKETSKALILADSIQPPTSDYPKRLLIKGHDPIARTKREAMDQYISYLQKQLVELENTKLRTQHLLATARDFPV